jgi:hypothetical protein
MCCSSTKPRRCHWQTFWPSPRPRRASCCWATPAARAADPGEPSRRCRRIFARPYPRSSRYRPPDRGLFLPETWRLHPLICSFNSELFYDGCLLPHPGLEHQAIKSKGRLNGAGLRYLPVVHEGNQSSSKEEADMIRDLVVEVLSNGTTWVNREGVEAPVGLEEIWRSDGCAGSYARSGRGLWAGMYLPTVAWLTSMPSLSSSAKCI